MTSTRRAWMLACAALTLAPLARAQAPRVRRIGVLVAGTLEGTRESLAEFRARLGKLGWSEGADLEVQAWATDGRSDRFPALVREAVARKVDVIVVASTPGARAAIELAPGIPVVFAHLGDPVGSGFVASLARPGGHATGTAIRMLDLAGKQIELLKALVPAVKRVAELRSPVLRKLSGNISTELTRAAARTGIVLVHLDAGKTEDIEPAFAAAVRERVQAMMVMPTALSFTEIERIVRLAKQHRIPTIHSSRLQVAAGGLASYGPDWVDAFAATASYVDKILRGTKPADLPVGQVDRFELVINRRTAAELGLTVPQSVLLQATEVIE